MLYAVLSLPSVCLVSALHSNELFVISSTTFVNQWNSYVNDVNDGNENTRPSIAVDAQENCVVAGWIKHSADASDKKYDWLILKYNKNQVLVASTTIVAVSTGSAKACGVVIDSSGTIYAAGYKYNGSNNDFLLVKYNSQLEMISSIIYNRGNNDFASAVALNSKGNIIVAGKNYITDTHACQAVMNYSPNLVLISSGTLGYSNESVWTTGMCVDKDDNVIITGYVGGGGTQNAISIAKFNADLSSAPLAHAFSFVDQGSSEDMGFGVATDANANIFITARSKINSYYDWLTIKLDAQLEYLAGVTFNGDLFNEILNDFPYGIKIDDKNNVLVIGSAFDGNDTVIPHFTIVKLVMI
jgi:hypothetical protein